jgi:hypothetical protein
VETLVFRQDIQHLLDLLVRLVTSIDPRHRYNRPSTHVRISVVASIKACASRVAMMPGTYRMSVDQELTRVKCGTIDGGIRAPPFSVYSWISHS